jgi:hypothetical protein
VSDEEEKVVNVRHYPNVVPVQVIRGVKTTHSFVNSYWSFTQTCKQVREELVPWLLEKPKVRTPLATLNDYVNVFHRPHPVSGKRIDWVEPDSSGPPLSGSGVEILQLLRHEHNNPEFDLRLRHFYTDSIMTYIQQREEGFSRYGDGLLMFRMFHVFYEGTSVSPHKQLESETFRRPLSDVESAAIHITTRTTIPGKEDEASDAEKLSHEIEISLELATSLPGERSREEQITLINHMIYQSRLALIPEITVCVSVAGGKVVWLVRPKEIIDLAWTGDPEGGEELCCRLRRTRL